ncbi:hypothetical protein [Nocardioides sp.]|uniref:hypothetical protein n=1 Tax=Nocardioides sp. TaxID=35761 RepID=UPI0035B11419
MRWNVSAAVVCLLVVLTGCTNPLDKEPSSARIPTGCGECEDEIAALVDEVQAIDGVEAVRSTRRTTRGVPVAYLTVGVDLTGKDVVSADISAVTDAVAEAAWRSDVSPLDVLSLGVTLRNGYEESDSYAFGADRTTYEQRWGERPSGAEWSPVQEDDDLEGCEVDGCTELFRDIARDASALPGVTAVLRSAYGSDTPTNASSAHVELRADEVDDGLVEQVAELVWRSEADPLDLISVTVETPEGGFPDTVTFQIDPDHGRDHERLEQMWGPRPTG